MPKIELRALGKTGLKLSSLGLGTAPLGQLFATVPERDGSAAIGAAHDAGLRYFDTSPFYGHGLAELRLGGGLRGAGAGADTVVSTKVGRIMRAPRNRADFEPYFWKGALHMQPHFDYSYDGIMRSYEDSLQRLGRNKVDILFIHDLDVWWHTTPDSLGAHRAALVSSGFRALKDLKDAGEIGAIGAGANDPDLMPWFVENFDIDCFLLALRYTLLDHALIEDEMPMIEKNGIGIILGAVFSSGIMATGTKNPGKFNYADPTPEIIEKVSRIEAVCARHDTPLAAAALQFPTGHGSVASVIPGANNADQVAGNVANFTRSIPSDLWAELRHEGLIHPEAPFPD